MKKLNKQKVFVCIFCALAACLVAQETYKPAPFTGWKQQSTDYFRFVYEDETREQTGRFIAIADEVWHTIAEGYHAPPLKTDVLITGRTNVVNASAEGIRFYMNFYTKPHAMEVFGFREAWERLFFTHELIHITQFSIKEPSLASKIFGRYFNLFDFMAVPTWYMEGLTTVFETELTNGGRGRSPWFELYYKAPSIENSFLDFNQIGLEQTPPRGQVYVMGYLVMRSIADQCGLAALSEIELARAEGLSFEKAIEKVTGFTPMQLFNDARKALVKKYAGERAVPEGLALLRSDERADYFIPALLHEGELFTIKQDGAGTEYAVKINVKTQKEDVLFEADFSDSYSLTAATNGAIVASLESLRYKGLPGTVGNSSLYTWTAEGGLTRLTKLGRNVYSPSLAENGERLVASELVGGQYRLVEVNLESGDITVLLKDNAISFVQPAVSPDGSKVVFLSLDGKRARLGLLDIESGLWSCVANDADDKIFDIAHPRWLDEQRVQFSSNERGRLEVWELNLAEKGSDLADEIRSTDEGSDLADGIRSAESAISEKMAFSRPVLADPVGAFWCGFSEDSLYYASYSSSGYTLKVKPASEYGAVPEFNGPSIPGEIICLGNLVNDYAGYWPFEKEEETDKKGKKLFGTTKKVRTPAIPMPTNSAPESVPANLTSAESRFYNIPTIDFWLPLVSFFELEDESLAPGFGAMIFASGYPLHNGERGNFIILDALYFPKLNNVSGGIVAQFPVGAVNFFIIGNRAFELDEQNRFTENNTLGTYLGLPLTDSYFFQKTLSFYIFWGFEIQQQQRYSDYFENKNSSYKAFGFTSRLSPRFYYTQLSTAQKIKQKISIEPSLLVSYYPDYANQLFPLAELSLLYGIGSRKLMAELSCNSRYYDLPSDVPLPSTLVTLRGETLDASIPGRTFLQLALVAPSSINKRLFVEKLVSWDLQGSYQIDPTWFTGIELELATSEVQVAFGIQKKVEKLKDFATFEGYRLYFNLQLGAWVVSE